MDIMKSFESFLKKNDILFQKKEHSLSFSYENKNFLLLLDPKDPNYYRLTLPKVGDGNIEKTKLNSILVVLTSEFKVGKTIDAKEEGIWFSYEQLLMSERTIDCDYVFARSISTLSEMLKRYREMIQETKASPILADDAHETL